MGMVRPAQVLDLSYQTLVVGPQISHRTYLSFSLTVCSVELKDFHLLSSSKN